MTVLDQNLIADQATKRFGIGFIGDEGEYDGEILKVIRPRDLHAPNGFAIAISKTTRVLEASFKADNFSGGLLRKMGDVDELKVADFISSINKLTDNGDIEFSINGEYTEKYRECFTGAAWSKMEFICERRLSSEAKVEQKKLDTVVSELVTGMLNSILILMQVEENSDVVPLFEIGLPEGAKKIVEVNKYERSPINRARCLDHHGFDCAACNNNFFEIYGPIGEEYIEVHHIIKISDMGAGYIVDPINDLVPLCSNCHSMIHRRDPPLSVEYLKELLSTPTKVGGSKALSTLVAVNESTIIIDEEDYE